MCRLYFVRHGESASNVGGVTMEHAAIPLTPRGVAQAAALAELLPAEPSRVLTSRFLRARDTARPFCERTGRQAEIHPLLHEFEMIDPALLAGMSGEQRRPIADAFWNRADPHERAGPRAETFAEFESRVDDFMGELATLPDRCVLFGHGQWLGLLLWKLMGCSATDSRGMRAFRRCQLGLPLSNGVVVVLESAGARQWRWQVDEPTSRQIASVTG